MHDTQVRESSESTGRVIDLRDGVADEVARDTISGDPITDDTVADVIDLEAPGLGVTDIDFDEIWQHRQEVKEVCQRIVGDPSLADDLVQETYIQALRNLHKLERRDGLIPWLVTVAKRRSLNELRRAKYSTPVETMPERQTAPELDPSESVAVADEVDRVKEVLAELTDRERDLLMRQVYDGLSLAELAEEEGTTPASVRSVLNRARSKLRSSVTDAGALLVAPLAALSGWAKRRLGPVNVRLQKTAPMVPAGHDRLAEIVAAGIMSLTIAGGAGGLAPAPEPAPAGTEPAVVETSEAGEAPEIRSTAPAVSEPTPAEDAVEETGPASSGPVAEPDADPTEALPIDPRDPLPRADRPDEASYHDVRSSRDGQHVLILGEAMGKCHVNCTTLFSSSDGGSSWERLPAVGLSATRLLLPPAYPADPRIFAAGPSGLQVSGDGGQNFEVIAGLPSGGPAAMSPGFSTGDARILVGGAPAWEYDAGSGSTRALTGVPVTGDSTHFAFAPDYATSGLLFAGSFGVADGQTKAAVFACRPRLGDDRCEDFTAIDGITSVPRVHVTSSFGRDETVVAWGSGGAVVSRDRGRTFSPTAIPYDTVTAVTDDGAGTLYAAGYSTTGEGTTGGVVASADGGKRWAPVGQGTALDGGTSTVRWTGRHLIAGPLESAGGGVLCSADGGSTWATSCPA